MKPQNYYSNETSVLDQMEIDVISDTIKNVLSNILQRFDIAGSLLLTGKKDGDNADVILEFDFEKGTDVGPRYTNYSRWVVEHVVKMFTPTRKLSGYIASFSDERVDEEVLILHTSEGLIICVICMDYPYTEVELYMTIAKTIAMMRPLDQKVQRAYQQLLEEEGSTLPALWMIDSYIDELFSKCREPKLKAWKKWYTKQAKSAEQVKS